MENKKAVASMNPTVAQKELMWIENNPSSFLNGQRNNDVVNWILLKMYLDQTEGIDKSSDDYVLDWNKISLTDMQKEHLDDWDRDPVEVIEDCYDRYHDGIIDNIEYLFIQ